MQQSGKELIDKDDFILKTFEENVTLAKSVTTDHPDPANAEIDIEKGSLSKTLAHTSSSSRSL